MHSLWQGLILAAVTGLIVLFTRKHSAVMRYNLLISALALFAVGVVVTFAMQMSEFKPAATNAVTTINNVTANAAIQIDTPTPTQNFTDSLFSYLNQHHNTIVMVWFLIICAKSIQLLVGLIGVRRLKHTKVNQVTIDWYNRLQQLADSLEIKKHVALLESGLAKVPMMIGALKPVILMPIGLLTALSTEEVEAILVHELAHIKRRDYLVNLLQSLMEIVFFFNPAVLWISQLIKAERENCCDDMVLSQSSNKVSYIRALISCEEYQAAVPAYAMAFASDKNNLMSRVKRMMSNRNHSLNLLEKTVLTVCLVVSGLCLSAFSQRKYITDTVSKVIHNIENQNKQLADTAAEKGTAEKNYGEELGKVISKAMDDSQMSKRLTEIISKNVADAHTGEKISVIISRDIAAARPGEDVNQKIADDIAALHLNEQIADKVNKDIATLRLNRHVANKVNTAIAHSHVNERFADAMTKEMVDTSKRKGIVVRDQESNAVYLLKDSSRLTPIKGRLTPANVDLGPLRVNTKVNSNVNSKVNVNANPNPDVNADPKINVNLDTTKKWNIHFKDGKKDTFVFRVNPKYAPGKIDVHQGIFGNNKIVFLSAAIRDTTKRFKIKAQPQFDISDALYNAHLITDKKNYKMSLDNKKMIVNGVKQPESVHQTFLKFYQKTPTDQVNITESVTN